MEEMKALEKNNTWEICALPKGHKVVGCKWVYPDLWYCLFKNFSPVAKLNTVKDLSVAVNKDWPLNQLDFKNAFLNGGLVDEVYMSPPPSFEAQFGQQVCKLHKSLYGLKQSPRAWFDRFTTFVKS
ncbi:hypothetical protein IC582_025014 [Cucumis melo]